MVDGLVQIGDGGKERNSEGRWRRKHENGEENVRDSWDEMKEKEEKNKEKKSLK